MARRRHRLRAAALAVGALPAIVLVARALGDELGANPIEEITHFTGAWTLRFLLASLAVTPLRRIGSWGGIAPLRRILGLTAFFYACLHFATFVALDHFFDWQAIAEDVGERRYVTAGFAAFLCLVPLAATSTDRMARRLGRRWTQLHRLAYLAAVCGVVHFLWLVKADLREPLAYAAVLALLLGYRLWHRRGRPARVAAATAEPRPAAR